MDGIWLASYVILWMVVLIETILLVGVLRQTGNLLLKVDKVAIPDTSEEGISISESVPDLINQLFKRGVSIEPEKPLILVFISPGCPGCDDLIPAIREFELHQGLKFNLVFISMEPSIPDQYNFIKSNGVRAPIVYLHGIEIALLCKVRSTPYVLLFDKNNVLRAKGPIGNYNGLSALIKMYLSFDPVHDPIEKEYD